MGPSAFAYDRDMYIGISCILPASINDMYTTTVTCTMKWSTLMAVIWNAYSWTTIDTKDTPWYTWGIPSHVIDAGAYMFI